MGSPRNFSSARTAHTPAIEAGGRDPILGSDCSWGGAKIGSVELLGCDAKLGFEQREDGLHIHRPIFLSEIRETMRIRSPSCPTEGGRGSDGVPVSAAALRS